MKKVLVFCLALAGTACVTTGTHEQALRDKDAAWKKEVDAVTEKLNQQTQAREQCEQNLAQTTQNLQKAQADLVARDMQIDKLLGEKGALSKERQQMAEEQKKLSEQIQQLERMRQAAEKRMTDYRELLSKLARMIDAGSLQVKIRNGLMLVQMPSDVLFPSASTNLKPEARSAIVELANTLASFQGRKFLILGHSDSTPIRTARFPSNWELSTQRAVEVAKIMIEAGVPPEMLTAAGAAEFDPLVDNDTPENRAINRRVEIIFMPKIDEMPGFEQVLQK
jgi:chemotaxis protein MotB